MGMIQRKKQLMMSQIGVIDTSPVILEYGKRYRSGGTIISDQAYCITKIYDCLVTNNERTFANYGLGISTLNYKNGSYYDYWNNSSESEPKSNSVLAKDLTDQMAFTIKTSMIDDCYVIYNKTGEILFAGKNSIYYGHRNISELS